MKRLCTILLVIVTIMVLMMLFSCGTTKTVVKSDTKVHEQTTTNADTSTVKTTVKQTYGDTLKAGNFIPVQALTDTDVMAKIFTLTGESQGIKYRETYKPIYSKGKFAGDQVQTEIIAKPITTTDTHEVQHSNVSTTIKKDSTAKVASKTTIKKGFGLPSWVWWLIGIIAAGAAAYIIIIKKFIP